MKNLFLMKIYHGIISIFILCFVSCDKEWEETNDLEMNNIKGHVCLIIEKEVELKDGEEIYSDETLLKYNRYGKILST